MWVFYLFAALLILQGIISLLGGVHYLSYVRREMNTQRLEFTPFASVIAPCRGLDQGLRANLEALFRQQYPAYEIIFVADRADDPALEVIEDVRRSFAAEGAPLEARTGPAARVVIAGQASDCGQKVHNLLAAVRTVAPSSEVLVFVDTDGRPRVDWLRTLAAPLADERIGATTGYRWFIPVSGGLASHLRAVWNASIASALGPESHKNFCWGGSTAIRRRTFEALNMMEQWRGTLSDDFALMRALRRAELPIHFVPGCLVGSLEDCSFVELLEFTTRQLKITRVYASQFWKSVLLGSTLFVLGFFGGLALVVARAFLGQSYAMPIALLSIIFLLGAGKAYLRLRAVAIPLASYRSELNKGAAAQLLLWPLAAVLYLYNAWAAAFSRRIEWRGLVYELKSPTETVIIPGVQMTETMPAGKTRRAR